MKKFALLLTGLSLGTLGLAGLHAPAEPHRELAPQQDVTITRSDEGWNPVDYEWPSGSEVPVLRPFSVGPANWNAGHRGVDLALAAGAAVYAAADGTVIYSGAINDRELVSIEHADGIRTTYEPIIPAVARGDEVRRGDLIGHVEGTHCAPSSCLHWGAKRGSSGYLDPLSLLVRAPIRLYE